MLEGHIYSRDDLRELFDVHDATINTGIFRPKGHDSVWLFVTALKPTDRTQYKDELVGDTLYWEGQLHGVKDPLIIEHEERGLELLVFYRKEKYEHPKAAFRYIGVFRYRKHTGAHPTRFVLEKATVQRVGKLGIDSVAE